MIRNRPSPSPHKVYVLLGFHTSFYHSWRGDTPDEAGFGTDIRVVRHILRLLDAANANGLEARGYWDFDVYWTLEQIIPHHAPDILDAIGRRVDAGLDEIVLGPYNNGANHAATERELRAAIAWAIENPFDSGLRQRFGRVSTLFRPQEGMLSAGQNRIYREEGITGLVLYYAGVPFNCLSTFIPTLPPELRYGLFNLRCQPGKPPIVAWPCISLADLVEEICLEALLLKLRRLQNSGQVRSNLLVHLNFDADGEPWLPAGVPRALRWLPNTGGLEEFIRIVNRYPWVEFTVPSEYAAGHPPSGEVLVRQDLADGGFDGNYSWAEKHTSLLNWTALEQSRLHTYRAEALLRHVPGPLPEEIRDRLWNGRHSAFFQRLVGLSTTHFGMSTPIINEERQAVAADLLSRARHQAAGAEHSAAAAIKAAAARHRGDHMAAPGPTPEAPAYTLYRFSLVRPAVDWASADPARFPVRLPVILPPGVTGFRLLDGSGHTTPASLINLSHLTDDSLAADLLFTAELGPEGSHDYHLVSAPASDTSSSILRNLSNHWLHLQLSAETGVASLTFEGHCIGSHDFLSPFITYRSGAKPRRWSPTSYTFDSLAGETWDGISRARMTTDIVMDTPHGSATTKIQLTWTLLDDLPFLLADVEVDYAATPPVHTIHTLQQKLRRLLDLRWLEVAPFQLKPAISAGAAPRPLRIWKHNFLGVTACYDLDYGVINPRNRSLDSFNHQVTAGWVAVSNAGADLALGLLLAQNAESLASMAFCPMRLREQDGIQHLWLNPFGSYHGRQLDYSHLGGTGVGAQLTVAASGALRPNGPSYNGQHLSFSLLLAPYRGDEPPAKTQAAAMAWFYPPGAIYLQAPAGLDVLLPDDIRHHVAATLSRRRHHDDSPLPVPRAFLANPLDRAVDLVWEDLRDPRVDACELRWRPAGQGPWSIRHIPTGNRWQVSGLQNGQAYQFQLRTLSGHVQSDWTPVAQAMPAPLGTTSLFSAIPAVSPLTLLHLVRHSLAHVLRTQLRPKTR